MIGKSLSRQSFAGCVNYVMKKDAEVLKAEGVMAIDKRSMIDSFEFQQSVRPEIKSPAGHITLSFSPEDSEKISNDFMVKLAEEYMQKMKFTNTQYLIVRHHDTHHEHCHIIYNRINNDKKLISKHNDFKRNEEVTKAIKHKYGLTFGKDKLSVNRDKLHGSERTRYEIYDAILKGIKGCESLSEFENRLKVHDIELKLKYKRGSNEVQGVSFTKNNTSFKGSQIDRLFSIKRLERVFKLNEKERKDAESQTLELKGVKLTIEQHNDLLDGTAIFLKGLMGKDGSTYDGYAKMTDDKKGVYFYSTNPDEMKATPQQVSAHKQVIAPQPSQSHEQSESFISGGTGLFDLPTNGGDDPEEDAFRNRMQKPKKRRGLKR